jgi:hypothetical protein
MIASATGLGVSVADGDDVGVGDGVTSGTVGVDVDEANCREAVGITVVTAGMDNGTRPLGPQAVAASKDNNKINLKRRVGIDSPPGQRLL